jgi:hypothetical protein
MGRIIDMALSPAHRALESDFRFGEKKIVG